MWRSGSESKEMNQLDPRLDAFRLHDERGFPLTAAMSAAQVAGVRVNLAAFACDAYAASWSGEKVRRVLEEACSDNGVHFDWEEFRFGLAALWAVCGKPKHHDMYQTMKRFIVDAPNRSAKILAHA